MDTLLKDNTFIRLGGKADFLATPNSYEQVTKLVRFCKDNKIPLTILGNGTNLIVRDGGIRGVVVMLCKLNNISISADRINAQSGAKLIDVSQKALDNRLTGLEFACGIPGTVGGAIYMNAGAYGGEIKHVLDYCLVIDKDGIIQKREQKDLELDYRYSNIEKNNEIILEACFKLDVGVYEKIKALMDDLTIRRKTTQPLEYPSCGSVFKRPNGEYVGKLIQKCNLQGLRIGGAEVSKKHAGFIVNINNATASEYIYLIEYIQKTVKELTNISLEREVKIIGEDLINQKNEPNIVLEKITL
jgi:UDP-N-acetylmuramate dehydrogenase